MAVRLAEKGEVPSRFVGLLSTMLSGNREARLLVAERIKDQG